MPEAHRIERWLAYWPCVLAVVMVWFVDGWFDRLLCLALLGHPLAMRSVPRKRRRRVVLVELPIVGVGCVAVAALLAANKAQLLGAGIPWGAVARFGGYLTVWILVLRAVYLGLAAVLRRWLERRSWASLLAGVLIVTLGMPNLFVALQTHRIAIPQPLLYDSPLAGSREVSFASDDGLTLRGTLLSRPEWGQAHPVVVVCHGVGANRANVHGYVALAFELGCHVLAFDARGHGDSDGTFTTLGDREADDIVAAVRWLRADRFAMHPVVLIGVSMGGASVLRAAAEADVAGVFAESSFADLGAMVGVRLASLGPLREFASWVVGCAAWVQLGVELHEVSPRRSLAALAEDVEVVLVHAADDRVIPIDEGKRLASARVGVELHQIEGAGHGACSYVAPLRMRQLLRGLVERLR